MFFLVHLNIYCKLNWTASDNLNCTCSLVCLIVSNLSNSSYSTGTMLDVLVSRKSEPLGNRYLGKVRIKPDIFEKLAHATMEAEKSHSCICKLEIKRASGVVKSESEDLRTRRAENVNLSLRAGEDQCFSFAVRQREQTLPFLCLFVPFRPSPDGMMPTHVREDCLLGPAVGSNAGLIWKHQQDTPRCNA